MVRPEAQGGGTGICDHKLKEGWESRIKAQINLQRMTGAGWPREETTKDPPKGGRGGEIVERFQKGFEGS